MIKHLTNKLFFYKSLTSICHRGWLKITGIGEKDQTVFVDNVQGCRLTDCDGKRLLIFDWDMDLLFWVIETSVLIEQSYKPLHILGRFLVSRHHGHRSGQTHQSTLCPTLIKCDLQTLVRKLSWKLFVRLVDSQVEIGSSLWKEAFMD